MLDDRSPQAVLEAISELRQWMAELSRTADALSDFAFKWTARNGGVPKARAAMDKLRADYLARFSQAPLESDTPAMQGLEERYQAWAVGWGIDTATQEDLERFDDETGLLSDFIDAASGFAAPKALAHRIGGRLAELSRAAVVLGCEDSTIAALKGAAALMPEIANGRAVLSDPATWTEARWQANQIFQGEAIAGIPLNRAWDVALEKLELAARNKIAGVAPASELRKPAAVIPDGFYSPTDIAKAMNVPEKADAIRMALKRLFDESRLPDVAWMENSNPAKGQAKILYRLSSVRLLLARFAPNTGA
jgi:hypothetical protein